MRNRKLADLDPRFLPIVYELLAKIVEAGIAVLIIETLRTEAQHQEDLVSGHSWVARSKHQDGLAIDVCLYEVYALHGPDKLQWDNGDSAWLRIGEIGESLGLRWGGRWAKKDMGHFELVS